MFTYFTHRVVFLHSTVNLDGKNVFFKDPEDMKNKKFLFSTIMYNNRSRNNNKLNIFFFILNEKGKSSFSLGFFPFSSIYLF